MYRIPSAAIAVLAMATHGLSTAPEACAADHAPVIRWSFRIPVPVPHPPAFLPDSTETFSDVTASRSDTTSDSIYIARSASRAELLRSSSTTIVDAIPVATSIIGAREGFSIRGARPGMTSIRIDGMQVHDPVLGGFGALPAEFFPLPPVVALDRLSLRTSPVDARHGDAYPGAIEIETWRGPHDRYTGELRFMTDLPGLAGWSDEITVGTVGQVGDTVLPAVKGSSRGRRSYELAVGGPIPGYDAVTFSVAGSLTTYDHFGATHDVYDMSDEFARARDTVAQRLWGRALRPSNLGRLPHQEAAVRWIGGRASWAMSERSRLDLDISYGSTISDGPTPVARGGESIPMAWRGLYMDDRSLVTGLLERDAQQPSVTLAQRRIGLTWSTALGERTDLRLSASSVLSRQEAGKRKNAGNVGPFGSYDITWDDRNGDAVFDYYAEGPTVDAFLNPFNPEPFIVPSRNALTGFYEGDAVGGASHNPFGMHGTIFPAHGNLAWQQLRESSEIDLRGDVGHEFMLFGNHARAEAGMAYHRYSFRGEYYLLPWFQGLSDVYGFEDDSEIARNSFESPDPRRDFLAKRRMPDMTSAYAQFRYGLGALTIRGGLRADLWDPAYPDINGRDLNDPHLFENAPAAPTRLLLSPRLGLSISTGQGAELFGSAALIRRMPELGYMFDTYALGIWLARLPSIGNVMLGPERIAIYELGWRGGMGDVLGIEASGYYHAAGDLVSSLFAGQPYVVVTHSNTGTARTYGLDVVIRSRPVPGLDLLLRYGCMRTSGTAPDTVTAMRILSRVVVVTDPDQASPLATDRTHTLTGRLGLGYGAGEGPMIGGIRPLERSAVALSVLFGTGLPYTNLDVRTPFTDYNGRRLPDLLQTDLHVERTIPVGELLGAATESLEMTLFIDVRNLLNITRPIGVHTDAGLYNRTGARFASSDDPNRNGAIEGLLETDFPATRLYRDIDSRKPETFDSQQYDNYGARLYNPYVDFDLDGVVTQHEKYEGYRRFVTTYKSLRTTYQAPRSVAIGVRVRF